MARVANLSRMATASVAKAPQGVVAGERAMASEGAAAAAVSGEAKAATRAVAELAPPSTVSNAGSPIRSFITAEDHTYYRVFSDNPVGRFLVGTPPASRAAAIEGLALPPHNTAQFLQEVLVPAGTRMQSSIATEAFGHSGGLLQFQLLDDIAPKSFGVGVPFP